MINDPRKYSTDYPQSNIIINHAIAALCNQNCLADLKKSLESNLKNENDALINVALNLAPSIEVSRIIWNALHQVINEDEEQKGAQIFAIPIVLVAGSKQRVKLNNQINVEKLNEFFVSKKIFNENTDSFISGKLVSPQEVANIKPSQFYYWVRGLKNANLGLPINLQPSLLEVHNEGVFLRFLYGITINAKIALNEENFKNSSLELMKLIVAELKHEQVTLFPIPFPPVRLSEAFTVGDNYRKEIAIQVALSNIIRKIRENSLVPEAYLSTENDALKITLTNKIKPELTEVSLWHLTHVDDLNVITDKIVHLLKDMQVEVIYCNE